MWLLMLWFKMNANIIKYYNSPISIPFKDNVCKYFSKTYKLSCFSTMLLLQGVLLAPAKALAETASVILGSATYLIIPASTLAHPAGGFSRPASFLLHPARCLARAAKTVLAPAKDLAGIASIVLVPARYIAGIARCLAISTNTVAGSARVLAVCEKHKLCYYGSKLPRAISVVRGNKGVSSCFVFAADCKHYALWWHRDFL